MNHINATRQRFSDSMRKVAVGSTLRRMGGTRHWTVLASRRRETSVDLTIGHGLRTRTLVVPICMSGPCLLDVGMESVTPNEEATPRCQRGNL